MHIAECYKILNVSPGTDWLMVRKSYHSLARQLHPDINPNEGSIQFGDARLKKINQAFEKLETHYKTKPDNKDTLDQRKTKFLALLNSINDNRFVQAAFRSSLIFLEELNNKVFQLDIQKDIKLSGSILHKGGSLNLKSGQERFEVKIPSGNWNEMSLRVAGKGERSLFSQLRGDLLLNLSVPMVKTAETVSSRFSYEIKIPTEKIASRKVLTLNSSEGPIKFILPSDTRDGQVFTLRSSLDRKSETLHIITVCLV